MAEHLEAMHRELDEQRYQVPNAQLCSGSGRKAKAATDQEKKAKDEREVS